MTICSSCKKKISVWKAFYVDDMILCEKCYKKNKSEKLRMKKTSSEKKDKEEFKKHEGKLQGLGGWLILFQIGLWGGLLLSLGGLATTENSIMWWFYLILIISTCCLIYLMYTTNKKFPLFYIIFEWTEFIILLFLVLLFGDILLLSTNIISLVIGNIIWTAYLLKSIRIKNTFVK